MISSFSADATIPRDLDKSTCIVLRDGQFDCTKKSDLDNILVRLGASPEMPLIVHFHGGLVPLQAGIDGANSLGKVYKNAGSNPVFFVWESGWKEVLDQNLPAIFHEPIFNRILLRVTQFAKAKLEQTVTPEGGIARGIGLLHVDSESTILDELDKARAPRPVEPFASLDPASVPAGEQLTDRELSQFQDVLKNDIAIQSEALAIANSLQSPSPIAGGIPKGIGVRASRRTLMSPQVLDEMRSPTDGSKGIMSLASVRIISGSVKVLVRVIDRFARRRDHGFYRTIMEEVLREFYVANAGQFLWEGMKKETVDAFGPDPTLRGGTAFLEGLKGLSREGKIPKRIILVGHSAGSIYICRFLQEAQRSLPPDIRFGVIFIAPACKFELLKQTFDTAANRIERLRVFGMGDQREQANALVPALPFLYPASLLYFISGTLEDQSDTPLVGMQRFYGGGPYDSQTPAVPAIISSSEFVRAHALIWALSSDGPGFNCDMKSHGGIEEAPALLDSLQHIISSGF